jgi:membrane protease YdiL (CAAX protease family)
MLPILGMNYSKIYNERAKIVRFFAPMNNPILKGLSPSLQLLYFVVLLFLFMFIGSFVASLVGVYGFGIPFDSLQLIIANPSIEYANAMMWMNNTAQFFTFLVPVVVFTAMFGKEKTNGLMLRPVSLLMLLASAAFVLFSAGLIDFSSQLNKWLIPEGSAIEAWAMPMEESAQRFRAAMLNSTGIITTITAFFSMAVGPAIFEELAFRGVMQPLIAKSVRNIHIAVWITAIAFSVFHMQFYGFLPRMIIGALLGYLVMWTGSIWPSILGHFANNAVALILYKVYGSMESPEGAVQSQWYAYAASLLCTVAFIIWFMRQSKWPQFSYWYLGKNTDANVSREQH